MKKRLYSFILAAAVLSVTLPSGSGMLKTYASETGTTAESSAGTEEKNKVGGGYAATGQIVEGGYTSQIYNATNGLPTSDANYVFCSSDGYIWIGSYSGILRYNGTDFERLETDGGLTSGRVIYEDSQSRIWVGTNDNGAVMIEDDMATHFTYKEGITSSSIRAFTEDVDGNVYVGTTAGVFYIDGDNIVHVIDDERINHERVLKMMTDADGLIYGQTRNGAIFTIRDGAIDEFYESRDLGIGLITTFLLDPEETGKIYIGTSESSVYYGEFGKKASYMEEIVAWPLENIHWISWDCDRIWITSTGGIGYIDETGEFVWLNNLPMNNSIEMMTSDYQGNMWFASSAQGVMKVVTSNFADLTEHTDCAGEVANATGLRDGKLYIGTDYGIYALDENLNCDDGDPLSQFIYDSRVRCIESDDSGNMWVSTFTGNLGLICYTPEGDILNYTVEDGLPSNEIRCTCVASDGRVLVGTNDGVAVLENGRVTRSFGTDEGINNAVILTVQEGNNDDIYAGSDGDGIYVIRGDQVLRIGRDDGLTSDVILRIRKDETHGVYWIVTSNSIEYMKDDVITNVSSFPYNNNYDIYIDDNDKAWILSSYGIYCVDVEDMLNDAVEDYNLYTLDNGLPYVPTSNSYGCLDEDGNLYVAGRDGVVKFNVNHFLDVTAEIKIDVSGIYCDNEEIYPDEEGRYTIPASDGRIQIIPAVLDYSMTDPMVHVYLEGGKDNGVTARKSDLSSLEYTSLKYGDYVLHIQIVDEATAEVLQDQTFNITKKPQLMELMLSKILVVTIFAILAGLIVWRVMTGTIIRKQYDQIRQARDEAERANSAKSRFLANISHEIRTPINTIMGMDEMIMRENATDVPKEYFLSVINYALDIRTATESLLGLINDLLDISKIESGKMHLVEQEYDTQDLLRSVVTMIRVRSEEKNLEFTTDIDETLPTRLYGDMSKIKQILLNFLTNAVKYTNMGGFVLKVRVEEKTNDSCRLRFSVKDSGIGIKPEDMDRLFTAYERLDEEKNIGVQGTGLGLDISRRFAELMKGTIRCKSEYGEGSEFILTLEQKIIDRQAIGEFVIRDDQVPKGPYVPQFVAPDAEILVVDDNPMNLTVIKNLLKATKMFVTTAESGAECIEKVKYGTYDVVLLDHMMPGMDGVETLAHIREIKPDLPVYALTANASAGEEFYKEKGFNGYLSKPIDSVALEKAILKYLPKNIVMTTSDNDALQDLTEIPEDMRWVYDVSQINVEDGIRNSGGITSYLFSLQLFYETIDNNADVIERAYNENDIQLYTVKVHALKTSARIIGAGELSHLAEQLEDAGHKKNTDFIDHHTDRLLSDYRAFKQIFAALGKKAEPEKDAETIAPEEMRQAYEMIREAVGEMDYDTIETALQQLDDYRLEEEDASRIEQLKTMLRNFDWDGMEQLFEKDN